MYTYKQTEPTLWTVGHHDERGGFHPESDHGSADEAANRVRWLNGANDLRLQYEGAPRAAADDAFDQWVILELMGHRRLAGRVREVQVAGAGFLRLDIPATGGHGEQTQYISPSSVYAMHPTTQEIATAAAANFRPQPVSRWELYGTDADGTKHFVPGGDSEWAETLDDEET